MYFSHGMGVSHSLKGYSTAAEPETSRIQTIEACTLCPLQPLHRSSEVSVATREEDAPRSSPSVSFFYTCIQRGAAQSAGVRKVVRSPMIGLSNPDGARAQRKSRAVRPREAWTGVVDET